MRTMTRGKAALAGALAAGLALVATPAVAAPGDPITLTVEESERTYTAGSWGDGIDFEVSGIPEEATGVSVSLASWGANGGGLVGDPVDGQREADGTFSGTILPEGSSPVAPDADGFPIYEVTAYYTYEGADGEVEYEYADAIQLTILEGLSVTGPAEATVAELAAGVNLQFAGFEPNENITGLITRLNPETNEWEEIGDFAATVGPNGDGEGVLTITGATAGDMFRVSAAGANGTVYHWLNAVAGDAEQPGGEEPGAEDPAPAPQAPRAPERVDTGA
ncbi:hypothetical protein D9V41_13020 [Aeromicrobium phragmitis]|uniref:Uncharacterized protein n=1 Tax=Aeromicrobium phragmitis TaxID=2478914 RepID=A0A3L8PIN2_9ACTN|nr:hypothetical protein [Aeromicrobium phragmitis]RLV55014.1 hypothetical protein D9V41_13020 [Aeromicrobium phragmitis]